jgi:two-component system LytT family response regulator
MIPKTKTIIVDDEKKARFLLKKMVETYLPQIEIVGLAQDIEEAEKLIKKHMPDIILLDIEMPNGDGFKLLENLKDLNHKFKVIFTTAFKDYAIKAIKYSAFDYILKPINKDELIQAIENAIRDKQLTLTQKQVEILVRNLNYNNTKGVKIIIPSFNRYIFLNPEEIYLLEADGSYTNIFTVAGEKHIASKNLKYFENLLDERTFLRINRSQIINTNYISELIKDDFTKIILFNNLTVEVSYRKRKEVMEKLMKKE